MIWNFGAENRLSYILMMLKIFHSISNGNNTADAAYFLTQNTNQSLYSKLFNNGKLYLYNASTLFNPTINFKDDNISVDIKLYKTDNQKILNLDGCYIN